MKTRVTELLGIEHPIVQGGMVWCSGARLAAAVSEAGGLGLLGAGSMRPEDLRSHWRKARSLTAKPLGVNLPIFHQHAEGCLEVILEERVPVVFTSAGSPKTYTPRLREAGILVAHVVATAAQAAKCEAAGVQLLVAEGFEAGGHNGPDELTTMVLTRLVRRATTLPLLAAGGIADGAGLVAALALGADGVQVGSRFAMTQESSAHEAFRAAVLASGEGDTRLMLKALAPVRLLRGAFFEAVAKAEAQGASREELRALLGQGRARRGMLEGDLLEGELEIGQVAALIEDLPLAGEVVRLLMRQAEATLAALPR